MRRLDPLFCAAGLLLAGAFVFAQTTTSTGAHKLAGSGISVSTSTDMFFVSASYELTPNGSLVSDGRVLIDGRGNVHVSPAELHDALASLSDAIQGA